MLAILPHSEHFCLFVASEQLATLLFGWSILTDTVNIQMAKARDFGLDNLLALNGDRYFVDDKGEFEAIFMERDFEEVDRWHRQL